MRQTHIIHQQRLELELEGEEDALFIQKDWSRWYQKRLLPKLEKRLNVLIPVDCYLKIPRLEVNLGAVQHSKTDRSLTEHCISAFEKALMQQLSELNTELCLSRESNAMVAFLEFLQTGHHSEWLLREPALLEKDILKAIEADFVKYEQEILRTLRSGRHCIHRLVWQFSDSFLTRFLLSFFKLNGLDELLLFGQLDRAYQQELWIEIIELVVLDTLASAKRLLLSLEMYLEHNLKEHYSTAAMIELRNEILGNKVLRYERKAKVFPTEEAIFVKNAGLVLLHPFLPTIAEALNCLDKNVFRNVSAQTRAIHAFQYLCTGELNTAEYLMPLNKILCNVPIYRPIEKELPLSVEAVQWIERLLESILEAEPALNGMTIRTFRDRFLCRRGKLLRNVASDAWMLFVEKRDSDNLEECFKWDYSVVALTWMRENLYVVL